MRIVRPKNAEFKRTSRDIRRDPPETIAVFGTVKAYWRFVLSSRQGFTYDRARVRVLWSYQGALFHNPVMEGWATIRSQSRP